MADCFSIKGVAMGDIGTWTISSETQDVSDRLHTNWLNIWLKELMTHLQLDIQ